MADRTSRETTTRERQERKVWRPGSALEAPEAPLGYKHRWIRESVMEFDDKTNVHKRRQEGYELVRAEEYPDYWHNEEPLSYDGYELEDLSDMDREEPCI